MSGYTIAAVWLGFCALFIVTVAGAARVAEWVAARQDAHYNAHRTPGMGDWSDTPIFDSVCEDVAADSARYIETEWWLEDRNQGGAA